MGYMQRVNKVRSMVIEITKGLTKKGLTVCMFCIIRVTCMFYCTFYSGQPVKKSVSQVTKAVDFHFRTDERVKQHPKNQEEYKEVNFTSELRKHPPSPVS